MNTAATREPRIVGLEVADEAIVARLADGRTISVPLAWSWRLADATPAQRQHFEILGTDEVQGTPAHFGGEETHP